MSAEPETLTPEVNTYLDKLIIDAEARIVNLEQEYKDAEYRLIALAGRIADSKEWLEEFRKRRGFELPTWPQESSPTQSEE